MNDVTSLFQEAQECAVALRGVSEAKHLLALIVPQDLLATVDLLKGRYRLHRADAKRGNVALIVLGRFVEELHTVMDECMIGRGRQSLGVLAGIYLATTLPRNGAAAIA